MAKKDVRLADKQPLLDVGNYEVYNRDVMRLVFPRIIDDIKAIKPRAKAGDLIPIYFLLLTNMNGQEALKNGEVNPRFGACFLGQKDIARMTGVGINRVPVMVEVLRINGVLSDVKETWEGTNRRIYYYPSFCSRITSDGYIVDSDGVIVRPDYDEIAEIL